MQASYHDADSSRLSRFGTAVHLTRASAPGDGGRLTPRKHRAPNESSRQNSKACPSGFHRERSVTARSGPSVTATC